MWYLWVLVRNMKVQREWFYRRKYCTCVSLVQGSVREGRLVTLLGSSWNMWNDHANIYETCQLPVQTARFFFKDQRCHAKLHWKSVWKKKQWKNQWCRFWWDMTYTSSLVSYCWWWPCQLALFLIARYCAILVEHVAQYRKKDKNIFENGKGHHLYSPNRSSKNLSYYKIELWIKVI